MSVALRALQSFVLLCFLLHSSVVNPFRRVGCGYTFVTEQQRKAYFAHLPDDKTTCGTSATQSPRERKNRPGDHRASASSL